MLTAVTFWIAADFFRNLCVSTRNLTQFRADAVQLTVGAQLAAGALSLTAVVFWIAADFFRSLCLPTRSLTQLWASAFQLIACALQLAAGAFFAYSGYMLDCS